MEMEEALFIISGLQPLPIILVLEKIYFFIQPFQNWFRAISIINQITIKKFSSFLFEPTWSLEIKSNHN